MTVPTHDKPRHKNTSAKRNIIRWCVGTAMLTATALIISIPLIMRAEDNIQQAANVKAYAATVTNTTDTTIQESKRQAKLYNARLANRTKPQTDDPADNSTNNQTDNPNTKSHRIQPTTHHPTQRRHSNHQLPKTRHQPTHTPRNQRTSARHRRRTLEGNIPTDRGSGNPHRHYRTPRPRRQTHVHQTRPSPRRR